jgi:hypothetical protein
MISHQATGTKINIRKGRFGNHSTNSTVKENARQQKTD